MSKRKLNTKDAENIRYLHSEYGYSQRELADMYLVGRTTIRHILNNETYTVKNHRPTTGPSPLKVTSNLTVDDLLRDSELSVYELEGKSWDHANVHWKDYEMEDTTVGTYMVVVAALVAAGAVGAIIAHAFGMF